jgi:hypothetical protein
MLYQHVRPPFWRRHKVITGAGLVLIAWLLIAGWHTTVAVIVICGLAMVVRRRRRALAIRDAGLRARAEYEHRLSLAGDPHGIYGRYPPVWTPDAVWR